MIATRTESRLPGFTKARARLLSAGIPIHIRDCGGSAFPIGPGSIQAAFILPWRPGSALGLDALYAVLSDPLLRTLRKLGLTALIGSMPGAFCPGSRDIVVRRRKIGGLAQAWRTPSAGGYGMVTASVLLDGDPAALCRLVNRFHRLAGSPRRCRPGAITTVYRESRFACPPAEFLNGLVEAARRWRPATSPRAPSPTIRPEKLASHTA